jgi:predicted solute-binding protein
LDYSSPSLFKPKVCAVSFLNTVPLVWGMLHGEQRELFNLSFEIPSVCADRLGEGSADVGLVPVYEVPRLGLEVAPGAGIACRGAVRSILLISRVPIPNIRTLAADTSSRTSVQLARIILDRQYGVRPRFLPMSPALPAMLAVADAALIIGDPALHIEPSTLPFHCLDLGEEWHRMTGLPFVFAVWAGRPDVIDDRIAAGLMESYRFGLQHLDAIIPAEARERHLPEPLVRNYLSRCIVYNLGFLEYEALRLFLQYAGYADSLRIAGTISV